MKKENISSIGTVIASLLATSCCIGPAIFVIFGTSIGFLSKLAFLTALRPYLLGGAFLMLSYSFWKLYLKKPHCACAEDIRTRKIARVIFWIGFAGLVFASSFQKVIVWIYG
ncbi:MAG: mercuric transporter MerT family protein [Nitrospiraceae bacterium]|nr:mercuric transporter MerT family protein [Nitrospiraceae bacterium]